MRNQKEALLLSGPQTMELEDGTQLRLLSALCVLEARQEAEELCTELGTDSALCANACIVAKAWEKRGKPICKNGRQVLERLSVSQIQSLAQRWAMFDREVNPGLQESQGRLDRLKKAWSTRRRSALSGACSACLERSPRKRG